MTEPNDQDPLDISKGLWNGCLFSILIVVIILILSQLACGMQTALPTAAPVRSAVIKYEPTKQPTATELGKTTVKTLGTVNVRLCPAMTCDVIDQTQDGQILEVGALITNDVVDCNRWYPIQWKKDGKTIGAFVCAEWMSK